MADLSDSSSVSSLNIDPETMPTRRHSLAKVLHWTCSSLLLAISVYVIVLAWSGGLTLFSLHPVLMSIAFLVIFPQAIALFDQDYWPKLNHKSRVTFHLYCQIAGIVCTVVGFVAVYVNKSLLGKNHFHTYHAICGLVLFIVVCGVGLGGTLAYYSFQLRTYIRPVLLKIYHSFGGLLLLILGNFTVILGFYSHWFRRNGNTDLIWVIISVIALSTVFVPRQSVRTLKERVLSTFGRNNL